MKFYQRLKNVMLELSVEESTQANEYGKEVIKETYEYILKGRYTNIKHKQIILNNIELSPKEIAKQYHQSEQAITKARYRIFKDLESRLSKNYLSYLEQRDWVKAADLLFLAKSHNLSQNYLLDSFLKELNQSIRNQNKLAYTSYQLKDCAKELKLLRLYSYPMMSDLLSEFDSSSLQKLVFLILLLDGKVGSSTDRHQLFRILANGNHQ
ncbi:hypothetical protein BN1058_01695 [Paraliobacillus sp. PM-2]|uniref:hypothetical protein n=1 Tax=Paraliobacillus sp. PM-2 TaxID=1462524 RepID=UPI00061BDC7B|nr:hypothetical protein [Paraliobacillus sp. PM-2]CQR47384.1 hypothetical protein BN1058_01695 [Paraliobacillus sp. PM-2]